MSRPSTTTTTTEINANNLSKIPQWLNKEFFKPAFKQVLNFKEISSIIPITTETPDKTVASDFIRVLLEVKLTAISTEDAVLVLEDFSRKKFHNVDRFKGFDMLHMRWALRKLAEFHAATTVYCETEGPYPDLYQESFCNASNIRMVKRITEKRQLHFRNAMRQWGLPHVEDFIKKMPTIKDYMEAVLNSNNVDPNEINVLNHGQLFNTNILFNYNESGVIDESWPTLMDIQQMMFKYGFWGPIAANTTLCNLLLPTSEQSSFENMFRPGHEGDILRYKSFTNPHYAKAMCQLIPFFAYKGI
ncbi:uncharacterized protein LOC119675638 [Teleopsis dalmanni]|uniref:uncharacterized protein LOC119675638 n=1 Tax=Teleopsis dalmanni TaxID=139649 RepID=UPI0018CECF79|nr:uncharacterized protein LOC119675638 [Teleopsis dalmanni]